MASGIYTLFPMMHLQIAAHSPMLGKFALHTEFCLGDPDSQPDEALDEAKQHDDANRDTEDIRSNELTAANLFPIQEVVGIPPLICQRDERNREVRNENQHQPRNMHPRHDLRPRYENLKQRK